MKKYLLFPIGSVVLTIPIYSRLLYKANSGLELSQSDVWTSLLVPLFVIGWMNSKKKGYSAYNLFLLTSAICTALEIHLSAYPSIFLLTTTMIGTLILPVQYIWTTKKQE
ncbi:hypothetical protein [Terribacillus saccharophilus]|uniref:hypothetical protein n=1 Tax=Terribacillus saccharophilus TaxID=361277 RepID=UPI002DC71CDA|nr:hypothetical protein [Terribacillus saccharophilus]